jgi:hypothetical protein
MKRIIATTLLTAALLLGSGCVQPAGSGSGYQPRQSDSSPRYEVGLHVGEENTAYFEALLHGRIASSGLEPPDGWSVRWFVWPVFGKASGPVNSDWFGSTSSQGSRRY